MNVLVIIIEAIVFAIIFTISVFTMAIKKKDTPAMIYNYPKDIQEEYFKTHERVDVSFKSKNVFITKSIAVLVFTIILFICSYVAGAKTFLEGFSLTFCLMLWIRNI